MNKTKIEWSDYSCNPLKLKLRVSGKLVNSCVKCSPGCKNCYAEGITRHWWPKSEGKFPGYTPALMKLGDAVINEAELHKMLTFRPKPPFKGGDRPRVFVQDMGDIFGEWVPFEMIDRLFAVFALRPDVDWQVLTKRPERMAEYLNSPGRAESIYNDWFVEMRDCGPGAQSRHKDFLRTWGQKDENYDASHPLARKNWWLGTSVENQAAADERIPHLLKCPAAIRFLSCEPLLGPVDLTYPTTGPIVPAHGIGIGWSFWFDCTDNFLPAGSSPIGQVIVGCESLGNRAGRFSGGYEAAARSLMLQCRSAGVPFFHKQNVVNGRVSHDPTEWAADLRVREFPATKVEVAK